MKSRTPTLIPTAVILIGGAWQAHAAFTAVDNFNSRSLGNVGGQGGWVATDTTSAVVLVDPANPINKIMRHSGSGAAGIPLPASIAENSTGTFFIRVKRVSTTNDISFGLSDLAATTTNVNNFASFEVQPNVNGLALRGRDVGVVTPNVVNNMLDTTWYKIWIVVNNNTGSATSNAVTPNDNYKYYVQVDDGPQTEYFPTDGIWNFRNGTTTALITAQFKTQTATSSLYFDDIYVDNTAANLSDPTAVANPDTDGDGLKDDWETFYFGNLAQTASDGATNGDNDGLTNLQEQTLGTNPTVADTDGDGINDGPEDSGSANTAYGNARTSPTNPDSDGDGLSDGQELTSTPKTDPNVVDTDGDLLSDYDESIYGSNATDVSSQPKLYPLIGANKRNGSFELLGGVTGSTAAAVHWDTDGNGDVNNWTIWTGQSTATAGGTATGTPSNGTRRAEIDNNNAAYNLTPYQAKEGDIIRLTWDHLSNSVGTGNHTMWVVYDDGAGTIVAFAPTATVSSAPGKPNKIIYKVPAGSPLIGKKIGVGVKAFANDQRIDNVVMTVVDGDSDSDGLSDFWEDQFFGNNDDNPQPAEIALQTGTGDPDGDGYNNLAEQAAGSFPNSASSNPGDTDSDGLADAWELDYAPNLTVLTGNGDPDHDFCTNEMEETGGTNPLGSSSYPDSDNDTLNDGWELAYFNNLATGNIDSDSDGFSNAAEMAAGSSPSDSNWTPVKAVLKHRWSFNGNLNDSVGNSNAQIIDADANPATGGGSSLSGTAVTLSGGLSTQSDYIDLGANLIQGKMTPVTIELWATQNSVQNWGRIFDFNNNTTNEYLMMSWTAGVNANADSVEWKDTSLVNKANTLAPFALGTQYHIVMTIIPSVNTNGEVANGARVNWYAAPAGSTSPLGLIQGSFDVPHHLVTFNDLHDWLGRSISATDNTANASYDEVRIWDGALSTTEAAVAQAAGPDAANLTLDSDSDGLPDAWEVAFFGNTSAQNGAGDADGDGSSNAAELAAGSLPNNIASVPGDADGDGLGDAWEFTNFGGFQATPGADPDGDRDTNLVEFTHSTDPNLKTSFFSATNDSVPDSWKAFYGISSQTGESDLDEGSGDGLDNLGEFTAGTSPIDKDSDNDGRFDGPEVNGPVFSNVLVFDTDHDGLSDGEEVIDEGETSGYGTTPTSPDTDGDSFEDGYEVSHSSDPLSAGSTPAQPNGFTLVEDFDGPGMVAGQSFNGVNGWVASDPAKATVFANTTDADNEGLWLSGNLSKSLGASALQILNGNTGTLFFQMYCDTVAIDRSLGLSDMSVPTGPGDFEAQLAPLTGNIRVRNGAATPDTNYDLPPQQWVNIWMVANNATDTVKVYIESPLGQTGKIELTTVGGPYGFRNGAAANALLSLAFLKFEAADGQILIDNIYVDAKAENLNNPLSGGDSDSDGMADAWETTYFGGLGQTATGDFENDGTDNLTEFRLGLIPNDGKSRFTAVRNTNGSITWPSTTGTTFKIERSTTLGAGGWTTLQAAYPGTAGTTTYTDPAPPAGVRIFYRVSLN
ncbi:hypothetical protein [Haloferula sp. BvORR071]|uniref:hypothetical protein n=1 Tax=Haloferula sp. BvORR071 TaxID=1396141 RepID=UPI0005568BC5|nr:hypothetical protein [Haloferula sp. BvORR071]